MEHSRQRGARPRGAGDEGAHEFDARREVGVVDGRPREVRVAAEVVVEPGLRELVGREHQAVHETARRRKKFSPALEASSGAQVEVSSAEKTEQREAADRGR